MLLEMWVEVKVHSYRAHTHVCWQLYAARKPRPCPSYNRLNPVPAEGREGDLTYPEELWRRLRRRIRRRAVALRWTDGTMCAAAPPRDTC